MPLELIQGGVRDTPAPVTACHGSRRREGGGKGGGLGDAIPQSDLKVKSPIFFLDTNLNIKKFQPFQNKGIEI